MAPLSVSTPATTRRSRAKSDRRTQLIAAAERLVAERGYLAVRLEDIGAAAGVSGPAIYRHFPNKEALLVELLVGISTRLLAGATAVVERATARGIRSDPHPGPGPRSSSTDRQTAGA